MKIKDMAIKEIINLPSDKLMILYELILSMKNSEKASNKERISSAYLKVRESLKNLNGNLSDDILSLREDRI